MNFTRFAILGFVMFTTAAKATCYLMEGRYGYTVLGHVDRGILYEGRYGYGVQGHFEDGKLLEGRYGYSVLGHPEGDLLMEGRYGYSVMGHFEGCSPSDFETHSPLTRAFAPEASESEPSAH